MNKKFTVALVGTLTLILSGCQKQPEEIPNSYSEEAESEVIEEHCVESGNNIDTSRLLDECDNIKVHWESDSIDVDGNGITDYVIVGTVNEEYKYEPANHSEEALQCFIDNLRPIVKYAEQFGVIVAIEPVWKHIVYTVERARKVLDAIDSPNLQIIFDPVNLLCVDNLAQQDEIIEKAFDLLLKDIAVVHCKDYIVEGSELKSVAAGTGKGNPVTGGCLNYPLLLKKIKEHKPYVHCTLENTVPENAVATREFMERTYASV